MKLLITILLTFASGIVCAAQSSQDAIIIDNDIIVASESKLIGNSVERNEESVNISLYLFADSQDYNICYIGNPQVAAKIAEQIVGAPTGDSRVTQSSVKVTGKKVAIAFQWYGEDGDHSTEYTLNRCK